MTENNISTDTIASTSAAGTACDKLIEAIETVAVENGVEMVLLHGEHESNLENVGMLLSVKDIYRFTDEAYGPIAFAAMKHGMYGGVLAQPSDRFANGYADMLGWFSEPERSKGYQKEGERLVAII